MTTNLSLIVFGVYLVLASVENFRHKPLWDLILINSQEKAKMTAT